MWETLLQDYETVLYGRGHRPRGIERYLNQVRSFLRFLGAGAQLVDITEESIERYQGHKARRCAPGTVGNALTSIRSFCRWLVKTKRLAADPTVGLVWPRRRKPAPRALAHAQLAQLWQALEVPARLAPGRRLIWRRNRRAIMLMLYGGLRIAEAAALLWCDVDLDTKTLVVRDGKGGKDRAIPLHPILLHELRQADDRAPERAVVGQSDGRPLGPKSLAHVFERWLKKRGLRISAHQLRHSFATEMLRAGADLRVIQELMGHDRLETTQRYLMVDAERMRSAVNMLPIRW